MQENTGGRRHSALRTIRAKLKLPEQGGAAVVESSDPHTRAMTDLCHVLLNSNEFLYLH